jgi:peptidoglycan/LPS O-acetylase OafA/YrhL
VVNESAIGGCELAARGEREAITVVGRARIPALDGVRGLAILIVLIHNASWVLAPSALLPMKLVMATTAIGWVGVQLFFVLSGFLITSILLETRESPHYLSNFYIRRVLRIFPLYYVFLFAALVIAPLVADPGWAAVARQNQWWLWTFTFNWGAPLGHSVLGLPHLWSLAVEEQFYLFWPFIVLLLSRRQLIALCFGALMLTPLIRLGLRLDGPSGAAYQFTVARWDALAGGALVAILLTTDSGRAWLAKALEPAALGSLVLIAIILLATHNFNENGLWTQVVGQSLTIFLFSWLVYIGVAPRTRFERATQRATSKQWLRFLGKYSYAIYLFHYPFHTIASNYLADAVNGQDDLWRLARWGLYVAGIATASILAALCSWRLLERPFLNLKDRLTVASRSSTRPSRPADSRT